MASLLLSTGKYLHTAYAVSNIAEEFTNDDWSLSSQEGFGYIGQYIDDSAVDSSDPTDYVWTEFLDEDVDDLDDEGDMPMADFQSQIDALQDQVEVLQGDTENLQSSIEVNASNVADSAQLASEAADIANATGQYFWHDANGAHVSTEENNPEGERNSIWNSLGMLFRKGATNLLAVLAGGASGTDPKGIAVYDGEGNDAENVVASFTDNGSMIGKQNDARTIIGNEEVSMINKDGVETFAIRNTDKQYSQFVRVNLTELLTYGETITKNIFPYSHPTSQGNFYILYSVATVSTSQILNPMFYYGTADTVTSTFTQDNSTVEITSVYDGDSTLTITATKTGTLSISTYITECAFSLISDAPSFTFGTRQPEYDEGAFSFTSGIGLIAQNNYETVVGEFNNPKQAMLFTIGNGANDTQRSNVVEVDLQNVIVRGDLEAIGGNITAANLTGSQTADYTGSYKMGNCTILTGSVTINVTSANTNTDKTVTFGPTFKHTPCVQCTMLNIGGSYYQRVTAAGPSTTGFTARIRAGGTPGNVIVNWVAIGELA